ncbi:uncharacterized protein ACN2A1_002228 isoform 1-T3 [Glossina fuscipes fuscipes]
MANTTAVLSTPLASFNENSNINNNGNPKATATNNSTACHSNHNSNFKPINDNSGSVCHSNISEMNNSTKVSVPSPKMTYKSEHLTGGSTSIKTTSIFGSIDGNMVGIASAVAFVNPQQLEQPLYVSHEDVTSLAGSSFLSSQVLLNVNQNASSNE